MIFRDRQTLQARAGYSLLELMVAMVLSLVVMGLMFAFLIPTMHASARGSSRVEMQQQAVVALGRIVTDLERSAPAAVSVNDNAYNALMPVSFAPCGNQPTPPPQAVPVVLAIQRLSNVNPCGDQEWENTIEAYVWNPVAGAPAPYTGSTVPYPGGAYTVGDLVEFTLHSGDDGVAIQVPPGACATNPTAPTKLTDTILMGISMASGPSPVQVLATDVSFFIVSMANQVTAGVGGPVQPVISQPITVYMQLVRQAATGGRMPEKFSFQRTVSLRNSN